MVVKDGRFGPYVTDGETNASLRKGDEVSTLTVERAAELLADRRTAAPSPRARRTSTAKTATKTPAAAKKPAAGAKKPTTAAKKPATAKKPTSSRKTTES
jgi:DNA topoisomerase I